MSHGHFQKDRKSVRNALRPPLIYHVVRKLVFLRKLFQENIQSLLVMPNPLLVDSYPVVVVSVDILFISTSGTSTLIAFHCTRSMGFNIIIHKQWSRC